MKDNPRDALFESFRFLHQQSFLGRKWGISKLGSREEWRHLRPTQYLDYEPIFEEIERDGARAHWQLGPSPIVAWAQTSGTTGKPKKIPINMDFVKSYRRTTWRFQRRILSRLRRESPMRAGLAAPLALLRSRTLCLTAPPHIGMAGTHPPLPVGFMSGWMAEWTPWWAKPFQLPTEKILRLATWETKIPEIIRESQSQSLRIIAGIPAVILQFCEAAKEEMEVPVLQKRWPYFGGLITSGTALTDIQKQKLQALAGDRPLSVTELYAATEGQFGFSSNDSSGTMELNEAEVLFTFLPITEMDQDSKVTKTLFSDELCRHQTYRVLVTTPGGLIQYALGDRIEVLEPATATQSLRFRIAGRDQEEISIATEKISRSQIRKLFEELLGSEPEYLIFPNEMNRQNKLYFMIDRQPLSKTKLSAIEIAEFLDETLQRINPSYAEMRKNDWVYTLPEIIPVEENLFSQIQKENQDKGQFKMQRLYKNSGELPDLFQKRFYSVRQ